MHFLRRFSLKIRCRKSRKRCFVALAGVKLSQSEREKPMKMDSAKSKKTAFLHYLPHPIKGRQTDAGSLSLCPPLKYPTCPHITQVVGLQNAMTDQKRRPGALGCRPKHGSGPSRTGAARSALRLSGILPDPQVITVTPAPMCYS